VCMIHADGFLTPRLFKSEQPYRLSRLIDRHKSHGCHGLDVPQILATH
jgi:hypothetical protein